MEIIKRHLWDIALRIHGTHHARQYAEIKSITTRDQLANFQQKYLSDLLLHAYNNAPYYHDVFDKIGLIRSGKVDLSRFKEIPILTKDAIRKHYAELISHDYRSRRWYCNSSGGSTGEPVTFIQDRSYNRWGNAAVDYYYRQFLGISEVNTRKIILWGSERDLSKGSVGWKARLANCLTNTIFLNSLKMTEEDMRHYIEIINAYKPQLIRGYADSLYDLCKYAAKKGRGMYTPGAVISSAETLNNEMRQTIEKILRTKVYDFYGSREVSGIAGECKEGSMHILGFHNYVEVLDNNNQQIKEGEEGRVIVTNLHNYSMPFIRYDIGDIAALGPKECRCGSPLPTLRRVTGRTIDHFIRKDGTIISGHALSLAFSNKNWVNRFQIIQEDYTKVRILIVPEDEAKEPEQKGIENKIKSMMGKDCQIRWDFVDEIPTTQSGKYLYIKSLIQR